MLRMFWKARDTTPGTPQNEYMVDYYARRGYAEAHYDGIRTDRGRIYVLLGKPAEVQNFSGSEKVVDCELWIYQNEGRRGLPPMLYLLFYRRDNLGDYVLFYPGLNSSLEILSTSYMRGSVSKARAYRIIQSSFPELAKASLSVIPEEANIAFAGTPNSSATVIGQIYGLPEKEVAKGYLRNFATVEGTVDVSYSAREIAAKAAFWLTEQNGIRFLNYSILPDVIRTVKNPDGFQTAHLVFNLRVADAAGRTIVQREKEIRLKLDAAKTRAMEERKFVFNDLAPIIEGDFDVSLTLTNRTTEEFAVLNQDTIDVAKLASDVVTLSERIVIPHSVFPVLPFSAPYADVKDTCETCCREANLELEDIEQEATTARIIPRIVDGIRRAGFIL